LSRLVFYLFLKLPGSEISGICRLNQACSCFACFDASFDPKPEAWAILKRADEAVLKARGVAGNQKLRVGDWPLGTGRVMPMLLRV